MKKLLTSLFILCSSAIHAQIQWQKCLGGSERDVAYSIRQTFDGGYIVAGFSRSKGGDIQLNHGHDDFWVIKLSVSGQIEWQQSLGGSKWDIAYSIQQTFDSGYIVVGETSSNDGDVSGKHGYSDYWVVKLFSSGHIQWQKTFGGSSSEYAQDVRQTTDSGYIITGMSYSSDGDISAHHGDHNTLDYWIIKLSNKGNLEWEKSLGGSNNEYAASICQTYDGGYLVAGSTQSDNGDVTGLHGMYSEDYWVVKLSPAGAIDWQRCYGGTQQDRCSSITRTMDSGCVLVGFSGSIDGDITTGYGTKGDWWIVKLSVKGEIQWQKTLGCSSYDGAYSIMQTSDTGYIITGFVTENDNDVSGFHGDIDCWVTKLSSEGSLEWQQCFGGSHSDFANSIIQTLDGGYALAGSSTSNDGDVHGNHGDEDFWIVKLAHETGSGNIKHNGPISIKPNPAKNIAYVSGAGLITIRIYSIVGKLLREVNNTDNVYTGDLPNDIYLIRLYSKNKELLYQGKLVKQ